MKEEYKEEVMAEDVVTLFHLGSEMAPENPPSERKKRGKETGRKQRSERGSVC